MEIAEANMNMKKQGEEKRGRRSSDDKFIIQKDKKLSFLESF